jgi:hypothetical protein
VTALTSLTTPLFQHIVYDLVLAREARHRVWPFVTASNWRLFEAAAAVATKRNLRPEPEGEPGALGWEASLDEAAGSDESGDEGHFWDGSGAEEEEEEDEEDEDDLVDDAAEPAGVEDDEAVAGPPLVWLGGQDP